MHQTKQVMVEDTGFLKPRRLRSLSEKKRQRDRLNMFPDRFLTGTTGIRIIETLWV